MKASKAAAIILLLFSYVFPARAQSDSTVVAATVLKYADSLLDAYRDHNADLYMELSYPGVVKYYGGRSGFQSFLGRMWMNADQKKENLPEQIALTQLIHENGDWQCVVQKSSHTTIDGRKALIISYLVGQSQDKGITWKYIDVSFASPQNLVYVMPDMSDALNVPDRRVVFESTEMAFN